ncbi:hypothetical protein BGZ65_007091, partial [Modicella reniformis]
MSWNEFLPELAVKHEVLESLYAYIGTPDGQKAKECQGLFDRFIGVINDHIDQVQQEKTRLVKECEQMMDNIKRMTTLVGQGEEGIARLVETLEGMNLWSRHSLLREEYTYILEHYTQKLGEIRTLHHELAEYETILGSAYVQAGPFPEEGAAVTFDVVQQFSNNIDACKKEQKRRMSAVESAVMSIKHLCNELGLTAQDVFEKGIMEPELGDYPLTDEAMRRLNTKQIMLEDERSKREMFVKDHLTKIIQLWDKLRIEKDEREEFIASHVGLTMNTVRAHIAELNKLMDLRGEKLQEFILEERDTLYELWDKLYYSPEQQEKFTVLFDDDFTEDNLAAHEAEVVRLKQEVEENEHILNAIEQYRKMLDDIREFEITSMDARRLFHRDPGRLLREEKFRKRIAREFPKVEKELEDALYEWQQINGGPFLVYGEEYIKTMKLHAEQAREGKENEKLWREQRKEMLLQRELRYGSRNPKKTVPQSPHLRRISPSLALPPDPPSLSSPLPQTPTSKRIGLPLTNRPGTPTSQHKRSTPSAVPTTPTRGRSQIIQETSSHPSGQSSNLHSPHTFHSLQLQRPNGTGDRLYSRSESPATTFSLSKLLSNPSSHYGAVRHSGPAAMLTNGESESKRNNSIISVSSVSSNNTEVVAGPLTPTRSSRINHAISYDLTRHSIQEEEEEERSLRTPHKRTTRELSSPSHTPPGSPSVRRSHRRKKSRSRSPQSEILSETIRSQPTESPFISKTSDRLGSTLFMTKATGQDNQFMKKLLEIQLEEAHTVADNINIVEDVPEEDSLIELDRSEAEMIFSLPKETVEVVGLRVDQDNESEGWETENDDSPRSRWELTKDGRGATLKTTTPRDDTGNDNALNSEDDARLVERIPLSSSPSTKQMPAFEIKSA